MQQARRDIWTPIAGVLAALTFVVGLVFVSDSPDDKDTDAQVLAWYADHGHRVRGDAVLDQPADQRAHYLSPAAAGEQAAGEQTGHGGAHLSGPALRRGDPIGGAHPLPRPIVGIAGADALDGGESFAEVGSAVDRRRARPLAERLPHRVIAEETHIALPSPILNRPGATAMVRSETAHVRTTTRLLCHALLMD